MRRTLKMSGSKYPSVEPGPHISTKPMRMIAIPMPNRMKLVRPNAIFSRFISFVFYFYIIYNIKVLAFMRRYLLMEI